MNRELYRTAVKWLGVLALAHLVSMIIFGIAFSGSIGYMFEEMPKRARLFVLMYDIIFDALFCALYFKFETADADYRRSIKNYLRENKFSMLKYFKTEVKKDHLAKLITFMVLQLPFVAFFALFGIEVYVPTIFEQFYYMDAAFYIITGSALLGLILNTLMFAVVCTLVRMLFIRLTKKYVEENMIV